MTKTNFNWSPDHPRVAADITGDRRADIVGFGPDGVWVTLNNGDGSVQEPRLAVVNFGFNDFWRVDQHPRFAADLTGDGKADIIGFGDQGVFVALNNGGGTFQAPRFVLNDFGVSSGWRVDQHPRFVTDLNGNGKADIIGFGDLGVLVALGNGDGTFQTPRFVVADFGVSSGWRVDQHPRFVTDLNGNGKADIIGFGDQGVFVALGNGDGTFEVPRFVLNDFGVSSGWRVDQHLRFVADLNGNGKADIIGFGDQGVFVALGNGDGTFEVPRFVLADFGVSRGWKVDQHPRFVADLTGDGKADIIAFGDDGVWRALNDGQGGFPEAQFILREFGRNSNRDLIVLEENVHDHRKLPIKHVFVLMLENRSFDHMLGFSGITGTDIATGQPTAIDGLDGTEGNSFEGTRFTVTRGAPDAMTRGPGHEFEHVLEQLCGPSAVYPPRGAYPEVNNSGYVSCHVKRFDNNRAAAADVMQCFTPDQVPVLTALAREFLVCDRWFESLPGPTQPNRMFMHAATSGEFDDSPTSFEIGVAATFNGFDFEGGHIFQHLEKSGLKYRIYAGDRFPDAALLEDIQFFLDVSDFEHFAGDLQDPSFDASYVLIEPSYDVHNDYRDGSSQHPDGSVAAGEWLIKATYEAIRNSPVWEQSVLIVTWDEHGGFYDHVSPGSTQRTGSIGRDHGFTFEQLGPRVPAVIVSPLIPRNTISHLKLDHASIPATVADLFDLPALEHSRNSGAGVSAFKHFLSLSQPRTDAPRTLPSPPIAAKVQVPFAQLVAQEPGTPGAEEISDDLIKVTLNAMIQHLKLEPGQRQAIVARVRQLRTRAEMLAYAKEVHALVEQRLGGGPGLGQNLGTIVAGSVVVADPQ